MRFQTNGDGLNHRPSGAPVDVSRRDVLRALAGAAAATGVLGAGLASAAPESDLRRPTEFQIACMTLPYSRFPFRRALTGIKGAGFDFIAWGVSHQEPERSERTPVLREDAPLSEAKTLARQCRDLGLTPLMMFSTVYPERDGAEEALTHRIRQAAAAEIPQVLTFGHTEGDNRALWIKRLKKLGPIAQDHNVTLVIKQHGGATGTGQACAEIVRQVNEPNIQVNYDAGNVMDYLNVDPIADIRECADVVRSFCIKDHRNWPLDQDCGPGLGEIDHYRLLHAVLKTGCPIPLCCENIFAPLVPQPKHPEAIDRLAKRARIFLETVVSGLQAHANS